MSLSSSIIREAAAVRSWEIVPIRGGRMDAVAAAADAPLRTDPKEVLGVASARAEDLVQTAQLQAERIRQRALEEAEEIHAQAQREGYAAGREAAEREVAEQREQFAVLVQEMRAAYGRFCEAQVPTLVGLAIQAAERLMLAQLTLEPEHVVAVVRQALEPITAASEITVHLHPEDVEIVRGHAAIQELRQSASVRLLSDGGVERGGCWIESEQGEVDATVSGRVARMALAVSEA